MGLPGNVRVFANYESLAVAAADYITELARWSLEAYGRFDWLLAGGRTPERLYRVLAGEPYRNKVAWSKMHFFWGDERCVPPDSPLSNFNLAKRYLLDPLNISPANIHRIAAEMEDAESVARQYQAELPKRPDLILLGMGADGHIASLFPGSDTLSQTTHFVVPAKGPTEPRQRITITPPVLGAAREILVLVCGSDKAPAVGRVFAEHDSIEQTPARLVRDRTWLLDQEAATGIGSGEF